ncbi:MAG: STAS domain-containing protein [Syntrophomonadales bacterium]
MADDSISVIKIQDVLLVTVPSDPDDALVNILQNKVLQGMERHRVKGLVLDISACQTVDSFFARVITETAQMVVLMGGKTVIAGMQPSVAITATQLGLKIGNALTALTVEHALQKIGATIQQERTK